VKIGFRSSSYTLDANHQMGKISRFGRWLGSDWRLPVVVVLAVVAIFVFSASGFNAMKEAHEAYLQWEFARDTERALRQCEELQREQMKRAAPQIVKIKTTQLPGL
jgi:hypothetical protein